MGAGPGGCSHLHAGLCSARGGSAFGQDQGGTGPSPAFGGSSSETGENLILPVLPELGIGSQELPPEASGDLLKRGMQKLLAQPELWSRAGLDSWLALSSVQGDRLRGPAPPGWESAP